MAGYNDTISNVYSFPYTSSSLLTFDLVHIQPQQQNIQRTNTRPEHSVFVNFVPGEGQGGSRTYNFQNKVTLKYSLLEIESLSFVLKNHAQTNGAAVTPYKKFADAGGQKKFVSVWQSSEQKNINNQQVNVRTIFIQGAANNKVTISMPPDQAYAIAEALHQMFLKGSELEINRMMNAPRVNYQKNQQKPAVQQQQPVNQKSNNGGFVSEDPGFNNNEQQMSNPNMNTGINEAASQFGNMIEDNPF